MSDSRPSTAVERERARQQPVQWRERFRTYLVAHAHHVRWERAQSQRAESVSDVLDVAMGDAPDADLSADESHVRALWHAFCALGDVRYFELAIIDAE